MKKKNKSINWKKIPYNIALILLTAGASLILGFLSFSGMYALYPLLGLAIATFALSVAYEGEIYLQNIKGALTKLFKSTYLEHSFAKEYLSEHFPENTDEECPQFFKDYKAQLLLLSQFEHKKLDTESKKRKKHITKTVKDMELWFAQQLFATLKKEENTPKYVLELQEWLAQHGQEEWQKRIKQRATRFNIAKGFSTLAALFMGLGSTYLLVEALSVIPFFAAIPFTFWPLIVLPMAIIAGTAYGLLTYNAVTDLIQNDTVIKWYKKLKAPFEKDGFTLKNAGMSFAALALGLLAVALTVCTAGTWWTIATNARPLFSWMSKMPSFIMGVINPIITGTSAIFFNVQNSSESLEMIDEATQNKKSVFQKIKDAFSDGWNHLTTTEHWLQLINPFRILIKLTVTPLRILLFLGHLVSIALTSDRMPGVPQIISMLVAIISEGFEDAHYFMSGGKDEAEKQQEQDFKEDILKPHLKEESDHQHKTDLPTQVLEIVTAPLYALSAFWDWLMSQCNKSGSGKRHLSLEEAWNKQRGIVPEEHVPVDPNAIGPSKAWQEEHVISLIERQKEKLAKSSINTESAGAKIIALKQLQNKVRENPQLQDTLSENSKNPVYNIHRIFAVTKKTSTQQFVEELPEHVGLMSDEDLDVQPNPPYGEVACIPRNA